MNPLFLVLVVLTPQLFVSANVVIDSISPTSGSTAGGTRWGCRSVVAGGECANTPFRRLTISGSGFSSDPYSNGGNVIWIGAYPCLPIDHLSSEAVLTCETQPGLSGVYTVTVLVDAEAYGSFYSYSYSSAITPSEWAPFTL
jgi:hypothetical protein